MNHVAMNPHLSEAGRHRYGLVGNHPHFRSPTISLPREPNGSAIDRANPNLFQCRDDSARPFVGLVCRVLEFPLRDGTSRRPAVLPAPAADAPHAPSPSGTPPPPLTLPLPPSS